MTKTFSTLVDLKSYIESACEEAVNDTAVEAMNKLQECIDRQYYDDPEFYPVWYQRTEEFLSSVVYQLLSHNSAEVFIDMDGIHYKNGFSGEQVVKWASQSKHGADYLQTSATDFWTTFIDWCNENLLNLLKQNLRKHGIKTK